jgi:1,4-alpha-glucan branching enzyme
MKNPIGSMALVLHAHLPYIRHPEHEDFLEEDWLFEAITETYVPLLQAFERLDDERVQYRLTMTVTPPLASMLADDLLESRYRNHLLKLRELVDRQVTDNDEQTPVGKTARFYRDWLTQTQEYVDGRWGGNLRDALREAQERGSVELITCTGTHGLLPTMGSDLARSAQVRVGAESYRRAFGREARGIWLAECGWQPGVDTLLAETGIEYFFTDSHGILLGEPRAALGLYAPTCTPAGVHAFARDVESSRQVWSSKEGYPGDAWYREFYRDLGYDADYDYIRPWLHQDGVRRGVGIKYHRVTGEVQLHEKQLWDVDRARARAEEHAGNFLFNRQAQARWIAGGMDRPPLIVSPYDAELYGHWWFEGPWFLEHFLRKAGTIQDELELITPADYIDRGHAVQEQVPNTSTWGDEGYFRVWLNGENAWFYRHQHRAERRMHELATRHPNATGLLREALDQAARELLLAQSSDWAFIVTMETTVPYAIRRFREHIDNFSKIASMIETGTIEEKRLRSVATEDPIFRWIDYRVFA